MIEKVRLQGAPGSTLADAAPKFRQSPFCPLTSANRQAISHDRRVHCASTCRGYPFERQARILKQTIHHAPRKGAMRASALQSEIYCFTRRDYRNFLTPLY